jgi:hypothetical protein
MLEGDARPPSIQGPDFPVVFVNNFPEPGSQPHNGNI